MKNISTDRRDRILFYQKFDWKFYMRASCIYMIAVLGTASVLFARPTSGQGLEQEVIIGMEHESVRVLFEKIEAVTDLSFTFKGESVDQYFDLTFPVERRTIRETLIIGLAGTGIEFYLKGMSIILLDESKRTAGEYSETAYMHGEGNDRYLLPVSGTVKDVQGVPLPGVNVIVKGTTIGTSTDVEGKFVIDIPSGQEILIFSFIGLKTVELSVTGKTNVEVQMEGDVTALSEVVINGGYYTTTDKMKTGSIVKVTSKEIESQPLASPLLALQGRVPGLEITPTSGVPGSSLRVQIRGRNSIRANSKTDVANSPLYVIDGVPIDPSPVPSGSNVVGTVFYGYDPLSSINPANIESIEILKDADATAIYGSRGANGVLLITTKKSGNSSGAKFDISMYKGIGAVAKWMDMLNTSEYLMMRREALRNDSTVVQAYDYDLNGVWDSTKYTNWQKELLGNKAQVYDMQFSISAGGRGTSIRIGASYHSETTIYPGDFGFSRLSTYLNGSHLSSDGKLSVSFSTNFGTSNNRTFESTTFLSQALQLAPNAPNLYNDDGTLNWEIAQSGATKWNTFENPVASLLRTAERTDANLVLNSNIGYKVANHVWAKINLGLNELVGDEIIKLPIAASSPTSQSFTRGSATFGMTRRSSWIVEPQIVLNRNFGEHGVSFIVGGTWQQAETKYQLTGGRGYVSDILLNDLKSASSLFSFSDVDNQFKYLALFARAEYDYKQRILVALTGRRDGSSRFGPGKRFGNFGAASVAWVFSNEQFAKGFNSVINFGKIRASYGLTGNDQIGDYKYFDSYTVSPYRYQGTIALNPLALSNPDFSWEQTKKLEAALELGILNDQISLEVDWYHNRSSSQLIDYNLPGSSGFSSVFLNSPAVVDNTGVEILIRSLNLSRSQFQWSSSFNISFNRNKLREFPDLESSSYALALKVGEPLSVRPLYSYNGVNKETGLYEVADLNGDDEISDLDLRVLNPTNRQYYGGVTNTLSYRGVELMFTFQFVSQDSPGINVGIAGSNNLNMPRYVLDRWTPGNPNSTVQKFTQGIDGRISNANFMVSNGNVVDASFLRLKTISFAWTLPSSISSRFRCETAKVFLQGQNIFTITNYPGLDPETEMSLPPLRMATIGFQLRF